MNKTTHPESRESQLSADTISWNAISFATVSWINPVLRLGNKKPLSEEDLPQIGKGEQASNISTWLDEYVKQTEDYSIGKRPKVSLAKLLFPRVLPILITDAIAQIIGIASSTGQSLLIQQILIYLEAKNGLIPSGKQVINNGYVWAIILLCLVVINAISTTISNSVSNVVQLRIRTALINAIYRKALFLSSKSRGKYPAGKINSFITTDTQIMMGLVDSINKIWSTPIQLAISIYYTSTFLGISTTVAAGVFVGLAFLPVAFMSVIQKAFKKYMATMDARTRILREFLYGIKVIKYHAMEEFQEQKVLSAREIQIKALYRITYAFIFMIGILVLQNSLTAPLTFITFAALGNPMNSATIFPALSFLSSLINISGQLPQVLFSVAQSTVSYRRLGTFLLAKELDENDSPVVKPFESHLEESIVYENASFSWETVQDSNASGITHDKKDGGFETPVAEKTENIFKLEEMNLSIKSGSLVAVVGLTGSGKSSLLSSMAGVMRKTGGKATIYGSLSYCSQDHWIISGTIEQNITLMDSSLNGACTQAIHACSLTKDLNTFPNGIKTQIGEKGINLSGGQKARIALARAIANDSDIYILDDPLSALDAHISQSVFEEAIKGPLLSEKTVVIATHLLHVLPQVDRVIVMDQGKILQIGTFQELMTETNSKLAEIMEDYHLDSEAQTLVSKKKNAQEVLKIDVTDDELQEAEDRKTGSVSMSVYYAYLKVIGFTWGAFQILAILILSTLYVVQQLTLSAWTSNYWGFSATTYLTLYSCLGATSSIVSVLNSGYTNVSAVRSSQHFHNMALSGLIATPMSFYDTQPVGRILNRMTNDVRTIDEGFGFVMNSVITQSYTSLAILIIACYSAWQVIPIVAVLVVVLYLVYRYFRNPYRELRRLMAIMQSPLTAHISESLAGFSSILSYKASGRFIQQQMKKLDQSNLSTLLWNHTMFWITLRLNILGSFMTFVIALLGIGGVMPYALVGSSLTQIMLFAPTLQGMLLVIATVEANMVAVERLDFYAHNLPTEKARVLERDSKELNSWPQNGAIEIENLKVAYDSRPDHAVVDGISLNVSAGEKLGVVGRTGSGKSTLMDAFFRLVEAQEGSIKIDGENIENIGLKKLRTSIQMIPQNPTLFDGTVRSNIDLLGNYSDKELWYALECVGMKEYVSSLTEKLDSVITEGGTNLSAGQRQLLCLATVLLKKAKIVIMDEATSSIDAESDKRIQYAIKTHFKEATILSVAHRLNTIAAFDKVLVLENGKIAEFDTPYLLLSNPKSKFSKMLEATGISNSAAVFEISKAHFEKRN
ncbi:Multidrug resistance-associated protein 1 [Physocladia obscura]|uniref:Multidrug resistance-associated protein 1 n=1 Tax=Physocladia obscura TaxID=109957 RepID=A0AAD5XFI2_9FUNG|nr:Multidrug resistance-associated protein 1 [Physocladia obscura]